MYQKFPQIAGLEFQQFALAPDWRGVGRRPLS